MHITDKSETNWLVEDKSGVKYDDGKPQVVRGVLQYFPRAIKEVAKVSEFGATKYTWRGWETVENGIQRYADALGRHILDESIDGKYAADSKLLHAAHAAWNALAKLELMLKSQEGAQCSNQK